MQIKNCISFISKGQNIQIHITFRIAVNRAVWPKKKCAKQDSKDFVTVVQVLDYL